MRRFVPYPNRNSGLDRWLTMRAPQIAAAVLPALRINPKIENAYRTG